MPINMAVRTRFHGFNPEIFKNGSVFTRLFFIALSFCSFIFCSYLIVLQIQEYQNQVLITKINIPNFPVFKIRFPSVTVCNFNVVYKDSIKNLIPVVTSHGVKQELFMDFVKNLSYLIEYGTGWLYNSSDYKKVYYALHRSGYNTDQIMAELAPPCKNMVKKCLWQAKEIPCSKIIRSVKSRYGYCCSFNYYGTHKAEQTIEDPQNLRLTHSSIAGMLYGLRLILDVEKEQYMSSIKPTAGFNVLVQDGADYINQNQMPTKSLLPGEELKLAITPTVYVTTENVRNLNLEQRKCLYPDERRLSWSSTYSFHTCMNECRAKAIFQICNCTPFYYPFENATRICNLFDAHCLEINRYDEDEFKDNENIPKYLYCECYPECDQKIFKIQAFNSPASKVSGYDNPNLSILNVYYNDDDCIKIEKDVSYTWHEFLAKIGGIFSLCLGASLISVIECFHFFGNSIYNNYRNNKRKEITLKSRKICLHVYIVQPRQSNNNYKKTLKQKQVLEYTS